MSRTSSPRIAALAGIALAALAAGSAGSPAMALAPDAPKAAAEKPPGSFAGVVDGVKAAVVSVKVVLADEAKAAGKTETKGEEQLPEALRNAPPQLREFLKRFGQNTPGQQEPQRKPGEQRSVGSGFIVSADGLVVTNNHVVDKAKTVQVTLDDGRTLDADVVGKDPKTDLALLRLRNPGDGLPVARLAAEPPRVGDWVLAIGNPFGLGGTVTAGIVSARGRDIGAGPYDDFLQIDAPINKGNSGGPTFNVDGEVVGVNTAIASPSGGSVGLAFAIPAPTVKAVVAQLREGGKVVRGYMGVQVQVVTDEIAESLGLDKAKGALVGNAQAGAPAARAGLRSGDLIQTLDGASVSDPRDLSRRVAARKPGDRIAVGFLRDGKVETAEVAVDALPDNPMSATDAPKEDGGPKLGMTLTPQAAGAKPTDGLAVAAVDPDGPAAAKGVQKGDTLLEVAGETVTSDKEVAEAVRAAEGRGRKAVLLRLRDAKGMFRFVALTPSKDAAPAKADKPAAEPDKG